jgi:hypothetical protein
MSELHQKGVAVCSNLREMIRQVMPGVREAFEENFASSIEQGH